MISRPVVSNILLLVVVILFAGCAASTKVQDTTQQASTTSSTKRYTNAKYNLAFDVPKTWSLVEESSLKIGEFAINIFSKNTQKDEGNLLNVHAQPQYSYITIWPKGLGTELPYSQYAPFKKAHGAPSLPFKANTSRSKILHLEDGTPWAYFIVPEMPPANWSEDGFIFAQIRNTNSRTICYDAQTDEQKPMEKCDFLEGDKVIRQGSIDKSDTKIVHTILKSISLEEITSKETRSDTIKVNQPLANAEITSPLAVKGKARGHWYFEGNFTIKLYDSNDNLLTESTAEAQGDWMTEQFVPFEATITFDAPDSIKGRLVFERANPSGKPANDQSYSIPVVFPSE